MLDMADLPARVGMALGWNNGTLPSYRLNTASGPVDLREVKVGWWRRVRPFTADPAVRSPQDVAFVHSETSQAVNGLLDSLPCTWVNPRASDTAAHQKPLQWSVAREVGLRLPRTLVTNEPTAARDFIDSVGLGKTIFKAFLASVEAWRETRLVLQEDLGKLDSVKYAPVIFQEYVTGVDLRITIIGEEVFAAEIDAQETSYPVDMRMVVGESKVKAVKLPEDVTRKLLELQRRLGIIYGAIDMRRTPEGEYYFFEVNPAGQWLFVEQRTGLPIGEAMAAYLTRLDRA